jgi:beta-1,4-mannosyltransferase
MKKDNIYIYPHNPKINYSNPYIKNLEESISPYFNIANTNTGSNAGIFKIFKYLTKLDFIWFNWVEDVPDRKGGYLQLAALVFIILFKRVFSVRIIWTMHNKLSHYKRNIIAKKFLFKLLIRNSDFILTHASEGLEIARQFKVRPQTKLKFIHHPLFNNLPEKSYEKDTDILIWGSIIPYKGIDKFLEYLYINKFAEKWKIKIIGEIPDKEYELKLSKYSNEFTVIQNRFIEFNQLKEEIYKSKFVLFTYLKDSVLSSGALMDSLSMGAIVIGPNYGAFKDLDEMGFVKSYNRWEEIENIIIKYNDLDFKQYSKAIEIFVKENHWKSFGSKILDWIL